MPSWKRTVRQVWSYGQIGNEKIPSEEYDHGVVMPGSKQLPRMPGKRRAVKPHQDQIGFGTAGQQSLVVQPQPTAVLPVYNVSERELGSQLPACGDQPMRRVFVS